MGSIIEDVILPLLMIIGPVIPFVPQAVLMHKEKSLGNFSIATCFVLWNANFLRILFWFGKLFSPVLLVQSVVMLVAQTALIWFAFPLSGDLRKDRYLRNTIRVIQISLFTAALNYFALKNAAVTEGIGIIALTFEACLPLPQFLNNWSTYSVRGVSSSMILGWFVGDVLKTYFFVLENAPAQFVACGIFQLSIDTLLSYQLLFYPKN